MSSIRRSVRGWLALAAFLGGLTLPFQSARHFWGIDDPSCDQASVYGLQTTTKIQTAAPASTTTHCTICHWQRAVGGASTASAQSVIAWVIPTDAPLPAVSRFVPSIVLSERPSRAPPPAFIS
jgi:hypothetical protein